MLLKSIKIGGDAHGVIVSIEGNVHRDMSSSPGQG